MAVLSFIFGLLNKQYMFYNKLMWIIVCQVFRVGIRTRVPLSISLLSEPLNQGSRPGKLIPWSSSVEGEGSNY